MAPSFQARLSSKRDGSGAWGKLVVWRGGSWNQGGYLKVLAVSVAHVN